MERGVGADHRIVAGDGQGGDGGLAETGELGVDERLKAGAAPVGLGDEILGAGKSVEAPAEL
jgi:hypothetical protein